MLDEIFALRSHGDESFTPRVLVDFHLAGLEIIGIVAKALKAQLAQSCCICFGRAAIDPDEFIFGIILIQSIFARIAMPEQENCAHLCKGHNRVIAYVSSSNHR